MTEAIFRGDHEPSLTAAQLIANLEIDWIQRRLPGYTPPLGKAPHKFFLPFPVELADCDAPGAEK